MAGSAFHIDGYREVMRALNKVEKGTKASVRDGLKKAAEPVKTLAEQRALGEIRNIGPAWSRMKVGVTTRDVYIALVARRRGGRPRPNLGGLLMRRAMVPAAEEKQDETVDAVRDTFMKLANSAGLRGGIGGTF